jgi:DnaJ-class molecular chaperone
MTICPTCDGSGEGMSDRTRCLRCHGRGEIPTEQEREAAEDAAERGDDDREERTEI